MIVCETAKEASEVRDFIHAEARGDGKFNAWQKGDTLPDHCKTLPPTAEELKQAARRSAKQLLNDPEALAVLFRGKVIADFKLFRTLIPTLTKAAYVKMITDEIDAGAADA